MKSKISIGQGSEKVVQNILNNEIRTGYFGTDENFITKGVFIERDKIIAFDNSQNLCYVEEFSNFGKAISYLLDDSELEYLIYQSTLELEYPESALKEWIDKSNYVNQYEDYSSAHVLILIENLIRKCKSAGFSASFNFSIESKKRTRKSYNLSINGQRIGSAFCKKTEDLYKLIGLGTLYLNLINNEPAKIYKLY